MTSMTEREWASVQQALIRGGLEDSINRILATRALKIHPRNRRLMEQAWDDGDGNTVHLIAGEEAPWFIGVYDDYEVCEGLEHEGVLYVAVYQSGGGLVSVIVGEGLVENDGGTTFKNLDEAKAYIQGRIA